MQPLLPGKCRKGPEGGGGGVWGGGGYSEHGHHEGSTMCRVKLQGLRQHYSASYIQEEILKLIEFDSTTALIVQPLQHTTKGVHLEGPACILYAPAPPSYYIAESIVSTMKVRVHAYPSRCTRSWCHRRYAPAMPWYIILILHMVLA